MTEDLSAYKKALQEEWEKEQATGPNAAAFLQSKAYKAAQIVADLAENAGDPRIRMQAATFILNNTTFAKEAPDELNSLMDKLAKDA